MNLEQFPGVNAGYVFELYERYRQNPDSIDPATRKIFEAWTPVEPDAPGSAAQAPAVGVQKIVGAANLTECIRRYGHLAAQLDPPGEAVQFLVRVKDYIEDPGYLMLES